MPSKTSIFWFRNNLRLHDNPALLKALDTDGPIFPVYVLDNTNLSVTPALGFPRMGSLRHQFLMESLNELKDKLQKAGNTLHIFSGNTLHILITLYRELNAQAIITQREYAWEEIQCEKQLSKQVNLKLHWGSMLYHPDQTDFTPDRSPFYFTRFKNRVTASHPPPHPVQAPTYIQPPPKTSLPSLPTREELNPSLPHPPLYKQAFHGGEDQGLSRLNSYIREKGPLHYAKSRNYFEGQNFSSLLAPWLSNGSLSPRLLYHRLLQLKLTHPEHSTDLIALTDQLIWRDYFRFLFLRYGTRLFTVEGLRKSRPSMYNDPKAFLRWRKGKTGHPLIDALMHQLAHTGFMSNRGRMLVSFYLAKEMKTNWQWGASWFESTLIDYDVCSNYGNWAYQAGRGTDSRVNRRFNLDKQAAKFDPDGSFIKKWGNIYP